MSKAPTIPLRSLVRDKYDPRRVGVLVSYGKKAARVQFRLGVPSEWLKINRMEALSPEQIAELLQREAEDLV